MGEPSPYSNALEFDWDVLRQASGEDVPGLAWGAAMSVSLGYWRALGCVDCELGITAKGREALASKGVVA